MNNFLRFLAAAPIFLSTSLATAQNIVANAPPGAGATTIYRQVMPDGRIVYSDTIIKGAKIDRTLSVPGGTISRHAEKPVGRDQTRSAGNSGTASARDNTGR